MPLQMLTSPLPGTQIKLQEELNKVKELGQSNEGLTFFPEVFNPEK